jgi:DUF4097 and DUF4098 domain-containing protein YvlB
MQWLEVTMRKLFVTILFMAFAAAANASSLTETIDRTFDVRSGAKLALDNVNGRITITSWDQPRIRVRAEKSIARTDAKDAKQAMAELRVEMEATADGVSVKTVMPKKNSAGLWDFMFGNFNNAKVIYEVTVPRVTNVDVSNTNGRIQMSGVTGVLHVETTNGRIEMERCGGSAEIETTNGAVKAELATLDPARPTRIETTNGRIDLTLPRTTRGSIDAETTNGKVQSDVPVTVRSSDKNSLRGTINGGGGASLRLRTTNGGIQIHAAP